MTQSVMSHYFVVQREWGVPVWALMVKNPLANAGDIREVGSIPGSRRSLRGGHDNPPQYSCLENLMDRGAWWATVHRVVSQGGKKLLHRKLQKTGEIH